MVLLHLLGYVVHYFGILQEKLQEWLLKAKRTLQDEVENKTKKFELSSCMLHFPFNFVVWKFSCGYIDIYDCIYT